MKPYRILIVSMRKPRGPYDIFNSVNMISYGLISEFSKLRHVTIEFQQSDIPIDESNGPWDFVLIHTYYNEMIFDQLPLLKTLTKYKIMSMMECIHNSHLIDHQFVYQNFGPEWNSYLTLIPNPILLKLIEPTESYLKEQGSILLDHVWGSPENIIDRSCDFYEWLKPLKDTRTIGQMQRCNLWKIENIPSWIHKVPETNYVEYLENTAPYENYILTHLGSYEHSIIDMASRGCRVIVPKINGNLFCPQCLVDSLKLPTFTTPEELMDILNTPPDCVSYDKTRFTDMSQAVSIINNYCQSVMEDESK